MNRAGETGMERAPPRHVAIIMDGNGRWARARGRPRTFGHRAGVEALRRTLEAAGELGVAYLTVFSFSTENWRRPQDEVDALMNLLQLFVKRDLDKLIREGIRVRVIGGRAELSPDLIQIIADAERRSAGNHRLHLTVAFNYGGQDEIVRAMRKIALDVKAGTLSPDQIDIGVVDSRLDTADLPPLDLLIRTSGERRISNFLLWQAAYAELVFSQTLWPDFGKADLEAALTEYQSRERKFGGVGAAGLGPALDRGAEDRQAEIVLDESLD